MEHLLQSNPKLVNSVTKMNEMEIVALIGSHTHLILKTSL